MVAYFDNHVLAERGMDGPVYGCLATDAELGDHAVLAD